jgi:hypothetical protein
MLLMPGVLVAVGVLPTAGLVEVMGAPVLLVPRGAMASRWPGVRAPEAGVPDVDEVVEPAPVLLPEDEAAPPALPPPEPPPPPCASAALEIPISSAVVKAGIFTAHLWGSLIPDDNGRRDASFHDRPESGLFSPAELPTIRRENMTLPIRAKPAHL